MMIREPKEDASELQNPSKGTVFGTSCIQLGSLGLRGLSQAGLPI